MSSQAAGKAAFFVAKIALTANFAEFLSAVIGSGEGETQEIQGVTG